MLVGGVESKHLLQAVAAMFIMADDSRHQQPGRFLARILDKCFGQEPFRLLLVPRVDIGDGLF